MLKKLINRPRAGTRKAKWLEELEQEKDFKALIWFTKRNIGVYYKTAAGRFFIKDNFMSITQGYQKWYKLVRIYND